MHAVYPAGALDFRDVAQDCEERALCFDADPVGNLLLDQDGHVRAVNDAARTMLAQNLLHLDTGGRLCVRGRGARGNGGAQLEPVKPSTPLQMRQISRTRWFVLKPRRLPGRSDLIHVRAKDVDISGPLDLTAVADAFGLSDSERPVLDGLGQAICPKEISRALGLSVHTIRSHLRSIYAKLGAHSAAEAQHIALTLYHVIHSDN